MKWLIVGLFVLAIALCATGMVWEEKARGSEDRAGAMLPYALAVIILIADFLIFVGWVFWHF